MICSECAEEPKAEGISVAMTGFGRSFEVEYFERQKGSGVLRPLLVFNPSLTHCEFWEGMVYLIVFHLSFTAGRVERNH